MSSRLWPTSSLIFLLVYALAYWLQAPAFYYLPMSGEFVLGLEKKSEELAMSWYGLISIATTGVLFSPMPMAAVKRIKLPVWNEIYWLLPLLLMTSILIKEWHWFQ